jgi:branched-chain amino acid transport system substrate-binding protein
MSIFFRSLCALILLLPLMAAAEDTNLKRTKLGAIVSLTGDAARNGRNWLEGAQLAIDELQAEGRQISLVVEDDGTVPARVATSFVKLATVDRVDGIIGGTWDFLAETAYPLAKQYRVPFITPTSPVEILSANARSNQWVFTNGLSLAAEQRAIDKFLSTKSIKTIALVFIKVPYGTSHAELVRETARKLGIAVLSENEITYQGFQDGIKLAALRIAQKKPEAVFVVLNYEGVDSLLREFERARVNSMVLMPHTLQEAFEFGASPKRYENAFGVFPKFSSSTFEKIFTDRYHRPPYDYAAAGYDAARFMAEVANRRGQEGLDKIDLTYEGVTGKHSLPAGDRSVVKTQASIMTVRDGLLFSYAKPALP